MIGAANDASSQSLPMLGWATPRRAVRMMPAKAARNPASAVDDDAAAVDGDAAEFGGARIGADGEDLPADADAAEEEPQHGADREHHQKQAGYAGERPVPDRLEAVRQIVERLSRGEAEIEPREDARRGQRHDEGGEPGADDEEAVERAAESAEEEPGEDGEGRRNVQDFHQPADDDGRQTADRTDREIHAARGEHRHLGEGDHREIGDAVGNDLEIIDRDELRRREREAAREDDDSDRRPARAAGEAPARTRILGAAHSWFLST